MLNCTTGLLDEELLTIVELVIGFLADYKGGTVMGAFYSLVVCGFGNVTFKFVEL